MPRWYPNDDKLRTPGAFPGFEQQGGATAVEGVVFNPFLPEYLDDPTMTTPAANPGVISGSGIYSGDGVFQFDINNVVSNSLDEAALFPFDFSELVGGVVLDATSFVGLAVRITPTTPAAIGGNVALGLGFANNGGDLTASGGGMAVVGHASTFPQTAGYLQSRLAGTQSLLSAAGAVMGNIILAVGGASASIAAFSQGAGTTGTVLALNTTGITAPDAPVGVFVVTANSTADNGPYTFAAKVEYAVINFETS